MGVYVTPTGESNNGGMWFEIGRLDNDDSIELAKAELIELRDKIKAALVAATPTNSRYAAALETFDEYCLIWGDINDSPTFDDWLKERLNSAGPNHA